MNGSADTPVQAAPLTEFERQRATAVRHVAANLDKVLLNLNKLNRNLQGITAVRGTYQCQLYKYTDSTYSWAKNLHRSKCSGRASKMSWPKTTTRRPPNPRLI